jgi:hypothetical protein
VNHLGYRTPGLLLLSTYQGYTLTGTILDYIQFRKSDEKSPTIRTWQSYIEYARLAYSQNVPISEDSNRSRLLERLYETERETQRAIATAG